MSTLVIKNLPEDLHRRLKEQAERNHRSMNKEVVRLIEASIDGAPRFVDLPPPLKLQSGSRPGIDDIETAIAQDQK